MGKTVPHEIEYKYEVDDDPVRFDQCPTELFWWRSKLYVKAENNACRDLTNGHWQYFRDHIHVFPVSLTSHTK